MLISVSKSFKTNLGWIRRTDLIPEIQYIYSFKTYNYLKYASKLDYIESTSSYGDLCRFDLNSMTEVKAVSGKGLGLFALTFIPASSKLGFYEGEVLTWREYDKRYPRGDSEYTFLLNPSAQRRELIYVDAADPATSNRLRYVNHDGERPNIITKIVSIPLGIDPISSKKPKERKFDDDNGNNLTGYGATKVYSISYRGIPRVLFETSCDVQAGEELCFDYGPKYTAPWKENLL